MFDEHSWGSFRSAAYPWSPEAQGQFFDKASHAYRALAHAELLLSDRVRDSFSDGNGITVFNPSKLPVSETISFPYEIFRGDCEALLSGGEEFPIELVSGENNFTEPESEDDFSKENITRLFIDRGEGQRSFMPLYPQWSSRDFIPKGELAGQEHRTRLQRKPYSVAEDAGFHQFILAARQKHHCSPYS